MQIFLQGKLLGIEPFVLAPSAESGEQVTVGRSLWVSLLAEVLPRALLSELGLSEILLGASGGGGFLIVLPAESLPAAEEFLARTSAAVSQRSGDRLSLVWASTENLGDWLIVRKRLAEAMSSRLNPCLQAESADTFAPFDASETDSDAWFSDFGARVRAAECFGWSPESPDEVLTAPGKYRWSAGSQAGGIPIARHAALSDDGSAPASLEVLAQRASGRPAWGVLRGDVDAFGVRLKRLGSIEEHIQLSVLFKQFFAGELEIACSLPEYFRHVSILYSGGDDFAVYGSWDALLKLAREVQRLFQRFSDAHLAALPGPEAKTISMALEVAEPGAPFAFAYEEAGRNLDAAKTDAKDSLHLFGKTVEWRQLAHAGSLKDTLVRMVRDKACPPEFLEELGGFYREKPSLTRPDRPWRYHRRLGAALGSHKDRELQKLQSSLIGDMIGRSPTQVKLRPAGLVAVAWARMSIDARESLRMVHG